MPTALLPGTSIPSAKPTSLDVWREAGRGHFAGDPRRRPSSRISRTTFEVQGLETLVEHWYTVAALTHELSPVIVDFYSDVIIHNARQFVPKDTWATHDSINKEPGVVMSAMGDFSAWIGPTTYYSRFVEFGTIKMAMRPFMIPAIDLAEPDFIKAFEQVAKLADYVGGPIGLGESGRDPRAKSIIQRFRGGLYTASKALGDIAVFGGRSTLGPIRADLISLAKGLGDVQALMQGTMSSRITRRLQGRATGTIRGYGTVSLSHAANYSGFPGGPGGHRIYNRFVGRLSTPAISTRLFGIG